VKPSRLALYLAVHVVLAIQMEEWREVATAHALVTFAVSLWWAAGGPSGHRVAFAGAYIVASEVLWRMTKAAIFWESAKYAITVLFGIWLLRRHRRTIPPQAMLYFVLLLPAVVVTLNQTPLAEARGQISFNLSGPLALAMCVLFFAGTTMTAREFQRLLLAPLGPLAGITTIAIQHTVTARVIEFTQESNRVTSGGFGPNQVAAALGLGALLALLVVLQPRARLSIRVIALVAMAVLTTQSALTLSRGGLIAAAAAGALAAWHLADDRRIRGQMLKLAPLVFAAAAWVIVPRLDAFTGGALSMRFRDTSPGLRLELVSGDLRIWRDNPVFGAGPGMARPLRSGASEPVAAHTEFTRLAAEHGLFGVLAAMLLIQMAWKRYRQARSPAAKALVASLTGWSLLFMLHSAMRLAAPSFLFGLAFASPVFRAAPVAAPAEEIEPELEPAPATGD